MELLLDFFLNCHQCMDFDVKNELVYPENQLYQYL
jgi:hypothetical protein